MKFSEKNKTDGRVLTDATNIIDSLRCLNYLISVEAEDAGKVRQYVAMSEERFEALLKLLGPKMLAMLEPAA